MHERVRDDKGLTLVELLLVVGLLGVILASVFLAQQALQASAGSTQRDAWVASSTGDSLLYLERTISQATSIGTTSTGTSIQFVTDQDLDGVKEQHNIVAAGGRLTDSVYFLSRGAPTGMPRLFTLVAGSSSRDLPANANDSTHGLFSYLASDGTTTVGPGGATSIDVTVWIRLQGQMYSDQKRVFLRNLQD